jgi:nucleoside phosphorylase
LSASHGKRAEGGEFKFSGSLNKPPHILLTAVSHLVSEHKMKGNQISRSISQMIQKYPNMQREYSHPGADQDLLYDAKYAHVGNSGTCKYCDSKQLKYRQARSSDVPEVHYGIIASGNQVMRHGVTRDQLREKHGVLCFEMEAAGLMDDFPCLVIRGICDYADSHKNKQWQGYAAATAAAYAKELLYMIPVPTREVPTQFPPVPNDFRSWPESGLVSAKSNSGNREQFSFNLR